jgi:C4-dicarboxylate-specific signal transduction histidine kinase
VHEEISSIASIVSHLHAFSDKKQGGNEELDINAVIQRILNLIKHHAKSQQIRIHFTPCKTELLIRANRNEIKQVLLNLFKNSFEAMPSGGEIFINTRTFQEQGTPLVSNSLSVIPDREFAMTIPMNIFLPFLLDKKRK